MNCHKLKYSAMAKFDKSDPNDNGSKDSTRSIPRANSDESGLDGNASNQSIQGIHSDSAKRKQPPLQRCYPVKSVSVSEAGKGDKSDDSDADSVAKTTTSGEDSLDLEQAAFPRGDDADMIVPPPQHPIETDYVARLNVHRVAFNQETFKTDFMEGSPDFVPKPKSKVISGQRMDEIIDVVRNRHKDPEGYLKKYKSILYDWTNTYQVDHRPLEDKYVLLRRPHIRLSQQNTPIKRKKIEHPKPAYCKVVCRPEEIFDAIDSCHREAAHKKVAPTYNLVCDYYYNITKNMVDRFVKLCPVCNVKPARTKKQVSGAVHPLHSFQYRVRFQADLIDFNNNPQRDIDGVVRRWVLVIKDHFTKYAWCRPLRRKTSRLVKHELVKLLNEVGWPLIFHTDNGSEFCAKVITELIRDLPFICSVTGRTRIPSDQGSVERLNQEIKKLIDQIIHEQHLKGNTGFTWLDALPFVTEAINKTYGFGVGKLAPYTHVYGINYKCPVGPPISEHEKKSIHTVHDLANYSEVHNMKPLLKQAGYDVDKQVQLKMGHGELHHDDDGTLHSDNDTGIEDGDILEHDNVGVLQKDVGVPGEIHMAKSMVGDHDIEEKQGSVLGETKYDYSPVDEYLAKKRKANEMIVSVPAIDEIKIPSPTIEKKTHPRKELFHETDSSDSSSNKSKPLIVHPTEVSVDGSVTKSLGHVDQNDDDSDPIKVYSGTEMKKKPSKPVEFQDFSMTKESEMQLVSKALEFTKSRNRHPHDLKYSYKNVLAEHSCKSCLEHCAYVSACVYEPSYYHRYLLDRSRWFEINTIILFISTIQHCNHNKSIQIVNSHMETPDTEIVLNKETKSIISILYKDRHYGVCEFVLKSRKLNIYDGMFPPLYHWRSVTAPLERRIELALSKQKDYVVSHFKNGKVKPPKKFSSNLCSKKWGHKIEQTDSVNCGPIAAMILWGLIVGSDCGMRQRSIRNLQKDFQEKHTWV